jgi:hypothetical protein
MPYTNIDDPSAYFQTATYTGAGANTAVTNGGNSDLQPDFLWIKNRTAGYGHFVVDSNRNISYAQNSSNAPYLETESTAAENNNQNWMASVNTNGFTTGISEHINNNFGSEFVAWQWKANGGTTSSNTDGSITSTVQANTDAGFSIVTYTGTGSAATVGHGLGVAPAVLIVKNRTTAVDWAVYHKDLTDAGYVIALNTTDAQLDSGTNRWNDTDTTSSVFSVGSGQQTNQNTNNMICYAFAEVQGYSKFGKYVGNGNDNGPFIYTGFKPAFVLTKGTTVSQWRLYDSARSPNNVNINRLFPYSSSAEATDTDAGIDMLSNGFKIRGSGGDYNASGTTYIYMAFAESPFTTSTGIPTTAR